MSGLSGMAPKRPSQAVAKPASDALGRLHVDIPIELMKDVKRRAIDDDSSVRELVINALNAYLGR